MSTESPVAILYDSSGNPIEVIVDQNEYHLGVASVQSVKEATLNSSTDNLAIGGSFTGTGQSTFGVAGLQINIITDQPCRVSLQQSMDNVNWDIEDTFEVYPDVGESRTIQATAAHLRTIVTNLGPGATTYFRLQTVLCPVVEALPRALTQDGLLRLSQATDSYIPDPLNFKAVGVRPALRMDYDRNLAVRGNVLTDEGSFRNDFPGTTLYTALTGSCVFANGLDAVIGTGTSFLSEVRKGQFIKLSTDGDDKVAIIRGVLSDTFMRLDEPYTGSSSTGTGQISEWRYEIAASGSVVYGSSLIVINSGTGNNETTHVHRHGDYLPYTCGFRARISQRIANQEVVIGFFNDDNNHGAVIVFDGVDNTKVKLRTNGDSSTEETLVGLPADLDTDDFIDFRIEVLAERVTLFADERKIAQHIGHIPGPYSELELTAGIENIGTPASTTALTLDWFYFSNFDRLEVNNSTSGDPLSVAEVRSSRANCTNVTAATSDTQLLAANAERTGATFFNDSNAILYLKLGDGAALTSYTVRMMARDYYELPYNYTGAVHGIWANANGFCRVTELV